MSFYRCENTLCGKEMIPADKVIWIADTYTVCDGNCKAQFLADNPELIKSHLKILGLDFPETREAFLKFAALVL